MGLLDTENHAISAILWEKKSKWFFMVNALDSDNTMSAVALQQNNVMLRARRIKINMWNGFLPLPWHLWETQTSMHHYVNCRTYICGFETRAGQETIKLHFMLWTFWSESLCNITCLLKWSELRIISWSPVRCKNPVVHIVRKKRMEFGILESPNSA